MVCNVLLISDADQNVMSQPRAGGTPLLTRRLKEGIGVMFFFLVLPGKQETEVHPQWLFITVTIGNPYFLDYTYTHIYSVLCVYISSCVYIVLYMYVHIVFYICVYIVFYVYVYICCVYSDIYTHMCISCFIYVCVHSVLCIYVSVVCVYSVIYVDIHLYISVYVLT